MLYLVGSLIFSVAALAALATIIANLTQYRAQMIAALRTLSLDGVHARTPRVRTPAPVGLGVSARRVRPAAPAPRLAA